MCTGRVMAGRQQLVVLHSKRVLGIKLAVMKQQRQRNGAVVVALRPHRQK